MARSCSVCRDPRVDAINTACLEGIGTKQIASDFGLTVAMIDAHRGSGHAGKALTRMVLDAHNGPLSSFAQIFIANKENRVRKLDEWLQKVDQAIIATPKDTPVDPKLLKVGVEIIRTAAQELGEWRPDGGEKAEALGKLAQSIVIHAAVEARNSTSNVEPKTIEAKCIETQGLDSDSNE